MDFAAKHLPDKFYLEGDQRVSLREKIFREVVANMIVHREYTNAHQASFIVYKDKVEILNANNPNGSGPISIKNFSPFPKNPTLSKFFVQLGRVEELGSGIINVNKYIKFYSPGSEPQFIENQLFRTIVPLPSKADIKISGEAEVSADSLTKRIVELLNEGINEGISEGIKARLIKIIKIIYQKDGIKTKGLAEMIGVSIQTIERDVNLLKMLQLIEFKGAKKIGGYILTGKFRMKF